MAALITGSCQPGWVRTWRKIPFDGLILQCRISVTMLDTLICGLAAKPESLGEAVCALKVSCTLLG
jgi:hypothetical protein